jgi:UDP-N-acetylglucosamine:LPS N-acetylglucosamine transferase
MSRKRKILIFTMEVGSGHRMPALSVQAAIAARHPHITTKLINVATDLGVPSFERNLVAQWHFFLDHPFLFDVVYAATRRRFRLVRAFDTIVSRPIAPGLIALLEKEEPDLVFCTHCTAANIIGRLKERGRCSVPTVELISDGFDAHAMWFAGPSDHYVFCDQDRVHHLLAAGVRREQVRIAGFPLRKEFSRKPVDSRGRREHPKRTQARLSVLLAFGGEGRGRAERQVRTILDADLDLDLVVICGKNDHLRARLSRLAAEQGQGRTRLIAHGFVDDIRGHLAAADITMGKSGTSFTLETLFLNKPFLITQAMANEWGCRDFVLQHRAGWYAPRTSDQVAILRSLVNDRGILAEYENNCRRLDVRNGAQEIADFLTELVDGTRKGRVRSRHTRLVSEPRRRGVDTSAGAPYHAAKP